MNWEHKSGVWFQGKNKNNRDPVENWSSSQNKKLNNHNVPEMTHKSDQGIYGLKRKIYLPCEHFITLWQANKQAYDNFETGMVFCVVSKCSKQFPWSVLEDDNTAIGAIACVDKSSFKKSSKSESSGSMGSFSEKQRNHNSQNNYSDNPNLRNNSNKSMSSQTNANNLGYSNYTSNDQYASKENANSKSKSYGQQVNNSNYSQSYNHNSNNAHVDRRNKTKSNENNQKKSDKIHQKDSYDDLESCILNENIEKLNKHASNYNSTKSNIKLNQERGKNGEVTCNETLSDQSNKQPTLSVLVYKINKNATKIEKKSELDHSMSESHAYSKNCANKLTVSEEEKFSSQFPQNKTENQLIPDMAKADKIVLVRKETNVDENVNSSVSLPARPVPAPRSIKVDGQNLGNKSDLPLQGQMAVNEISNMQDSKEKGAISKKKGSQEQIKVNDVVFAPLLFMCNDCSKLLHTDNIEVHKGAGHKVFSLKDGIQIQMEEEKNKLELMKADIQSKLQEQRMYDSVVDSFHSLWSNVYKAIPKKKSDSVSHDEANHILYKIQEVSENKLPSDICYVFAQSFRKMVENLKLKEEQWVQNRGTGTTIPLWLLLSTLKMSVAILISEAVYQGKQIFVIRGKDGSEVAKLSLQDHRLLLSPFLKNVATKDDDYCFQYELLEHFFDKEAALTFMKISYGDQESNSPIIIRVNTANFWGKQFRSMCTAEMGQSYLGTRFFRNCWIGKEGHHIWGGDYSDNDGSGGNSVILEKNSSLTLSPRNIIPGLIASRFGHKDKSTIFRIYLKGLKTDFSEQYAFAEIVEGLPILQNAASLGVITKAVISDVGLVAELK